jgi:hypothetical protein
MRFVLCKEQHRKKLDFFRDCALAEVPPLKAGWSDFMYFSLSVFILFAHLLHFFTSGIYE